MGKENYSDVFSITATLVTVILTINVPSLLLKIIFMICFVAGYVLFQKRHKRRNMILFIILCLIEIVILLISFNNIGSMKKYLSRIREFFVTEEQADNGLKSTDNGGNISERIAEINNSIIAINDHLDGFSEEFKKYSSFKDKEDQEEIGEIVKEINEMVDEENEKGNFFNLKTDKREVQLFYKMKLSHKLYYYCNIIKALEQYGINCEEMEIDESALACWDVQRLYAVYNMKKSIEGDLNKGIEYDKKVLYYNEHKVDMFEYSDTFDYGDWRREDTNLTAEELNGVLSDRIMEYYKKLILNFNENID